MNTDLNYIFITNKPEIGNAVAQLGVDWIMIDLEINGKNARQEGRNTVISGHSLNDVQKMRLALDDPRLLVRINPMGPNSEEEINSVISSGANAIMLPYFSSRFEVENFIEIVNKRSQVFLLLETLKGIEELDSILSLTGIDYVHIGLNDLHIQRKTKFMFEFLTDGSLEPVVESLKNYNIPFGIGGVGKLGHLVPTPERILTEHIRVGSSGVILSRSFLNQNNYDSSKNFIRDFKLEFGMMTEFVSSLQGNSPEFFLDNRETLISEIATVAKNFSS